MSTQVTNYQCPACTGPLHFAGASGRLECEYCGTSFDVAEIEALYAEKEAKASEWDLSSLQGNWDSDADGVKSYSCPSCGAELICDATTAATSCPYCGNPSIVPGRHHVAAQHGRARLGDVLLR